MSRKDSKPGVFDYCSGKLKLTELQLLLKNFGCSHQGRKDDLKQRLREFAANREQWPALLFANGARRILKSRGRTSGGRDKRVSAKRADAAFGPKNDRNQPVVYVSKRSAIGLGKDARPDSELEAIRTWVS